MQLEDYFERDDEGRIRVKGTRIDVAVILRDYLAGLLPEQIVSNYRRSLNLEQVFATLTYYLHNKAEMEAYLARTTATEERNYQDYLQKEKPEVVERLVAIKVVHLVESRVASHAPTGLHPPAQGRGNAAHPGLTPAVDATCPERAASGSNPRMQPFQGRQT